MRFFIFIFFLIIIFFSCFNFQPHRAEVVFFNVGQGDSFLLHTPKGLNILVDGGPDWTTLYDLGKYFFPKRPIIDLLILSHGHDDHLSSLPELVNRYQVKQVFLPSRLDTYTGSVLLSTLSNNKIIINYPKENFCLELETDCHLCLFPPEKEFLNSDDDNDLSLGINFNCSGLSVSAFGDASSKREKKLSLQNNLVAQILKASHHGSLYSNSDDLVEKVNPQVFLISVGKNNYGQPAPEIINRIKLKGIKIWRTDQNGDVLFYSKNSQLYSIKPW